MDPFVHPSYDTERLNSITQSTMEKVEEHLNRLGWYIAVPLKLEIAVDYSSNSYVFVVRLPFEDRPFAAKQAVDINRIDGIFNDQQFIETVAAQMMLGPERWGTQK